MHQSVVADVRACLRLYSRLPVGVGRDGHSMPDLSRVGWAIPLAGALIGGIGGATIFVARTANLPPLLAAALALGALTLSTGAIHEDGLADMADGFGGGVTREEKLAIMRDSRLGAFGAVTLFLSILMRAFALAAIAERGTLLAAAAAVAVGALSRVAGLAPMIVLPAARSDGAGAAAAAQSSAFAPGAMIVACGIGLLPWLAGAPLAQAVFAQVVAHGAGFVVAQLARGQIGGYTGDILGGAQQAAEVAALTVLAAA